MPIFLFVHPMEVHLSERVERERRAHTDDDVLARSYALKDRFAHIWTFPSRLRLFGLMDEYARDLRGKTVLDYGCGRGEASLKYLKAGADKVVGIDISSEYIAEALRTAEAAGFDSARFDFRAMDAHRLDFPDASFDLVIGYGILHHLDADVALAEIHRALKPGGRVLLQEPLADHPLLKLFRRLTPNARTEDEAPFSGAEIKRLTERPEWRTELAYCGILEAPVAMLTSVLMPDRPQNALLRLADRIERWLHRQGLWSNWNQYVLFNMRKA